LGLVYTKVKISLYQKGVVYTKIRSVYIKINCVPIMTYKIFETKNCTGFGEIVEN